MKTRVMFFVPLLLAIFAQPTKSIEIPCEEFHPQMRYPCKCGLNEVNATVINCNSAVFAEFPLLPYRFYIQEFSQRSAGKNKGQRFAAF